MHSHVNLAVPYFENWATLLEIIERVAQESTPGIILVDKDLGTYVSLAYLRGLLEPRVPPDEALGRLSGG